MSSISQEQPPTEGIELNAGFYALAMILSGSWIAMRMFFDNHDGLAMMFAVLLGMTIVLRFWLTGVQFFIVLGYLFQSGRGNPAVADLLADGTVMMGAATLLYLIASSRYVCLMSPVVPYSVASTTFRESCAFLINSLRPDKTDAVQPTETDGKVRLGRRLKSNMRPDEFITGAIRIAVVAGVTLAILSYVKLLPSRYVVLNYKLLDVSLRGITIAWLLMAVLGLAVLASAIVVWKYKTPQEAGVYLRSVITKRSARDLSPIMRRMVKHRRKSLVTSLRKGRRKPEIELLDPEGQPVTARSEKSRRQPPNRKRSTPPRR